MTNEGVCWMWSSVERYYSLVKVIGNVNSRFNVTISI